MVRAEGKGTVCLIFQSELTRLTTTLRVHHVTVFTNRVSSPNEVPPPPGAVLLPLVSTPTLFVHVSYQLNPIHHGEFS